MDIMDVTDIDLDNENSIYYELFSLFEYYIKKYYNYIITFYELDGISKIEKQNNNEINRNESNNNFDIIDETNLNKLCVSIGNSILEDSYEIIYEENIDKEL
jgi:hypothetical protein